MTERQGNKQFDMPSWTGLPPETKSRVVTFHEGISNCLLPCLEVIIPLIHLLANIYSPSCQHRLILKTT